jgi:hypothetical protein
MNVTSEQVELIVQRVLERLRTQVADSAPTGSSSAPAASAAVSHVAHINEHVVTQALLAGAVNGSNQVRIGAKAILTPSARDFARTGGIEVVRETIPGRARPSACGQVIITTPTPQIAGAVEILKDRGIAGDPQLLGLPAEAAAQATSAICRGEATRVIVFSSQPEVVACQTNRNDQIRAATAADAVAIERIHKNLNANVLAIDPLGKSLHELKACLNAFLKS